MEIDELLGNIKNVFILYVLLVTLKKRQNLINIYESSVKIKLIRFSLSYLVK